MGYFFIDILLKQHDALYPLEMFSYLWNMQCICPTLVFVNQILLLLLPVNVLIVLVCDLKESICLIIGAVICFTLVLVGQV